jgi:hypothetical protein
MIQKQRVILRCEGSVLRKSGKPPRRTDSRLPARQASFARMTIVTALSLLLFSFSSKKDKKFIPPGTIQITETFFADKFEISNGVWAEYEWSIKNKYGSRSSEHLATLPDTLVWLEKSTHNEPYVSYYYRHPAYKNYPVVGISYEQALAFCKWRTERVKTFCYIRDKKEKNIEYRLPTKEEWELFTTALDRVFFITMAKMKKDK